MSDTEPSAALQRYKVVAEIIVKIEDADLLKQRALSRFDDRDYGDRPSNQAERAVDRAALEVDVIEQLYAAIDEERMFPAGSIVSISGTTSVLVWESDEEADE